MNHHTTLNHAGSLTDCPYMICQYGDSMLTLQLNYPDGHSEIVHVKEAIRMELCAYCDEPMQVELPQIKYYCKDSHRNRVGSGLKKNA